MKACEGCPTKKIQNIEIFDNPEEIYTKFVIVPCTASPGVEARKAERMNYCIRRFHHEREKEANVVA